MARHQCIPPPGSYPLLTAMLVPCLPDAISLARNVIAHYSFIVQLELSNGRPRYTFYDGPPFATGLPHYGHLLASTIKDIIPRYWSMKGYHVERRFGWDTHGLPIEHEIDKKLGISGKAAVTQFGIEKYNEECRAIVMRYASEWRSTIERLGRWIDFDNDYKVKIPGQFIPTSKLTLESQDYGPEVHGDTLVGVQAAL